MNDTYSDFWLNEESVEEENYSKLDLNLIQLAAYRLAISNFVKILTNKNVPVKFKTSGNSSTDGETIYITSKISCKKDFDVTVGLALHESAHIVLSDMNILKTLWQRIPREIYELSEKINMSKESVWELTKDMINYVEDRYIDWYVYTTSVGYQGYYIELYNKYFNSKINNVALKSELYRSLDVESYTFRIFNFTNENTDLAALPDLEKIYKMIDYKNISRLKTPSDRFLTAVECVKLILKNISDVNTTETKSEIGSKTTSKCDNHLNKSEQSDNDEPSTNLKDKNSDNSNKDVELADSDNKEENVKNDDTNDDTDQDNKTDESKSEKKQNGNVKKLTKTLIEKVKNSFKNQKKFMDHQFLKKSLNKLDNNTISNIENSGMTLIKVGEDFFGTNVDCVFVKNLTRELLMDEKFPLNDGNNVLTHRENENCIRNGISLGQLLGKRLQIRNSVNTTKFMRKSSGKIDRRTLSDLAFDSPTVFFTNQMDKYKNANIHISVDASSSMGGEKWRNTLTTVVAICKACSMINNVNVVVSFRTSVKVSTNTYTPYVVIAYDSTKDSFNKIKNDFSHIYPANTTPEGLCFEPIVKNLPAKNSDEDYYFINLSDGLPYLSVEINNLTHMYQGRKAAEHTRNQIKKVIRSGYEVLSYFIHINTLNNGNIGISDVDTNEITEQFRMMYGKNASFINVKNLLEIAKTLNIMFLKKEN